MDRQAGYEPDDIKATTRPGCDGASIAGIRSGFQRPSRFRRGFAVVRCISQDELPFGRSRGNAHTFRYLGSDLLSWTSFKPHRNPASPVEHRPCDDRWTDMSAGFPDFPELQRDQQELGRDPNRISDQPASGSLSARPAEAGELPCRGGPLWRAARCAAVRWNRRT